MKTRFIVLSFAMALAACSARKHPALDGWDEGAAGYQRALAEQKTSGRPVLLYFHTSWCGWCSKLEHDVLSTSDFRDGFRTALKVRVNPEENRANADLGAQFGVHSFPTVYVIARGEVRPIVGYRPPDAYLASLRAAAGD